MKTLTLLRHAKSGWDDPVARDFDRPLNAKGKRAAAMVGRHMRTLGLTFDHAIASPAVRVSETLEQIESGYGRTIAPTLDRRVYLASAATLLDVVHGFPGDAESALLVGHNPGLEDLVLMLVADGADPLRDAVEDKYPTASIAELQFDTADWADIATGTARLTRFIRPRDLDPTLGPDAD
ncbi:phosphohistidine phosphatase [Sphingomonas sp. HMP9]|uniref:SixA phosphatase family protein n=1 Tax=Sphingomonas sp. HMP9 TaxID=1517554 RepID=UPI0015971561|nr:histidine phosphatase family protein [Sphingomonas sp. HMP9]BCA63197.1 phosphohistidine phosphatase [Sphingomonas sp. HMP9]